MRDYVVTSEGVVVFDALGTPSLGWALLQDIRKRTDKKIRYVIASHYHADHIYGLQAFNDHSEAIIVAQERSGEYKDNEPTADEKANQRLDQRRAALFPWVDANTRVVPPDITFKERMTIALGETAANAALCRSGPLFQRHHDDGRAGRRAVCRRHRAERPDSLHEQRGRFRRRSGSVRWMKSPHWTRNSSFPVMAETSTEAKQAIAFTRDYIQYVRDTMAVAAQNWIDFDVAYEQADWSKYRDMPAFGEQQPWQCLSNLSGTGTITVPS